MATLVQTNVARTVQLIQERKANSLITGYSRKVKTRDPATSMSFSMWCMACVWLGRANGVIFTSFDVVRKSPALLEINDVYKVGRPRMRMRIGSNLFSISAQFSEAVHHRPPQEHHNIKGS
jgi:hypothetical protein